MKTVNVNNTTYTMYTIDVPRISNTCNFAEVCCCAIFTHSVNDKTDHPTVH